MTPTSDHQRISIGPHAPDGPTARRRCPRRAIRNDADLLLRRELAPGGAADLFNNLFCRFFHRHGFLPHLRSFNGYDGPEILPISTRPFCLIGADAGQSVTPARLSRRQVLERHHPARSRSSKSVAICTNPAMISAGTSRGWAGRSSPAKFTAISSSRLLVYCSPNFTGSRLRVITPLVS